MIKLFAPYIPEVAYRMISDTLHSGCITQGPRVDEFENKFKEKFHLRYAVSVNSGTSALELAYELLDIGPGDEIITTPLTCAATNIPILRRGAKIVWADIKEDTLTIDPWDVRCKMTEKTKAVVQVHLGGVKAEAGVSHVPVVSDAAQALGIFSGTYTCCSFQAIKHITTCDGGMLVCPDYDSYKKAKLLRWFGIDRTRTIPDSWQSYRTRMMSFDIELPGTKRHMNDLDAAMGLAGLQAYDFVILHRKKLFSIYKERLSKIDGIKVIDGKENVCWLCTLLVERRDDFAKMLWDAGIESNLVQVRNDTYAIFGGKKADLPVLNEIESKYISIPLGMNISEENAEYICEKIEGGW